MANYLRRAGVDIPGSEVETLGSEVDTLSTKPSARGRQQYHDRARIAAILILCPATRKHPVEHQIWATSQQAMVTQGSEFAFNRDFV